MRHRVAALRFSAAQQCGSLRNAALAALNTQVRRSAAAALTLHSLHWKFRDRMTHRLGLQPQKAQL